MAQFARPNVDLATGFGGFTPSGAPFFWDELDEVSPDDATSQLTGTFSFTDDFFQVGLSTVTDPGVNTGHVLRARLFDDSGISGGLVVNLMEDAGFIAAIANGGDGNGVYYTDSYAISPAEANAITNYASLNIRVDELSGSLGASGIYSVSWLELEVPSAGSAALSGTVTASIGEADIVAGGKTIIITLTGDTLIAN